MSDNLKWEEILRNCVVDNKIKALHLKVIPKMKDCERWQDVLFLGRIHYKFKYTEYNGGLIRFNGKLFYINPRQIQALSNIHKWNISNEIQVVD